MGTITSGVRLFENNEECSNDLHSYVARTIRRQNFGVKIG